jgi:hypothetical protein
MPDQTAERALLRDVIAWARANVWRYDGTGSEKTWERDSGGRYVVVGVELCHHEACVDFSLRVIDNGVETMTGADDVRRAVDILAALGVLPAEFSSAYAAGVREGLDTAESLTDDAIEERAGLELDALLARLDNDDTRRALGDWYDDILVDPPILPDEPPYGRRIRLEAIVEGVSEILGVRNAS